MMKNIYNSLSQQKVGHPCSKAFLTKDWCAYMKETNNFEIWQKMWQYFKHGAVFK